MAILGIYEGHSDPSVALINKGKILAFCEEERPLRFKHAFGIYPERALSYCLETAGIKMSDVEYVATNWNLDAFTDGRMKNFFDNMNNKYPVDAATLAFQNRILSIFNKKSYTAKHEMYWRRIFGNVKLPEIHGIPHHYSHAFMACHHSSFDSALCLTIDGSGDEHCTVIWDYNGDTISPIYSIPMPHSLGWFYAAITEYLGFDAYDGEYKVMGLAAYGRQNDELMKKMNTVVKAAPDGVGYEIGTEFIHYGAHSYSGRFTDALASLFAREPRLPTGPIDSWHEDLAFAAQKALETAVERLVDWGLDKLGYDNLCIGGGVGLNVKMNSNLFMNKRVKNIFPHPLCADSGGAIGAALALDFAMHGSIPEKLDSLSLGHEFSNNEIRAALDIAQLRYEKAENICAIVAKELAAGKIVAWFQGRMEGGPRALGNRSILADPRKPDNRDRVNAIIKFREYWRPFCPSMTAEAAPQYFDRYVDAPFMVIAFTANEKLKKDAPAIVHVDDSCRVQIVHKETSKLYHSLIKAFEKETGVPVLLNTSFNIKGEPIVCTPHDALRTFCSTGLDILAIGDFLVRKN